MIAKLSARVAAHEQGLLEARAELRSVDAELHRAHDEIAALEDQLGVDSAGRPLSVVPLLAMVVSTAAALTAVVLAYVMALMALPMFRPHGIDSDAHAIAWGLFACGLVGPLAFAFGRRPGAGGSARALLRPLTPPLLALSLVVGLGLYAYGSLR